MIYLSLIFWLVLLLPGYAAMRCVAPRLVSGGLPGAVAISMFSAFALASPVNIVGHAFGAPVWVFSAWLIVLVIAAIVLITKRKWWRDVYALLRTGLCIELLVLAVYLILASRIGNALVGDAHTHLSRIRLLTDAGLVNGHPFFGGRFFFPTYHTNIWHALIASCSQTPGLRHHDVWWMTLPVSGLLIFGGMWQLTWTVFQRQWPAWVAALFALGAFGSLTFLGYPNKIAPLWLMPLMFVFLIEALREPTHWRHILLIAAGGIVLGEVHGLYAAFAAIIIGPIAAAVAVYRLTRREIRAALMLACVGLAVGGGVAFPAYAGIRSDILENRLNLSDDDDTQQQRRAARAQSEQDDEQIDSRLGEGFSSTWWQPALVVVAGIVLLVVLRKSRLAVATMLAVFLITAFWQWFPPAYGVLKMLLREDFAVARMGANFKIAYVVLVAGGAAALLARALQRLESKRIIIWSCRIVGLVALPIGALQFAPKKNSSWEFFWTSAKAPSEIRTQRLDNLHALGDLAQAEIPPGAVVLSPPALGQLLTTLTDCELIDSYDNNLGVENRRQREKDLPLLLDTRLSPRQRAILLDRYDIRCVAWIGDPPGWLRRQAVRSDSIDIPLLPGPVGIYTLPEHDD